MTTSEEWRPIPGFPGYEASSEGRVRSSKPGRGLRVLKGVPNRHRGGYLGVSLSIDGGHFYRPVHTLVAAAFHGPRPVGAEVRHLDGNALNNATRNLAYGTHAENMQDCLRHGTHPAASKTECSNGHAFTPENTYVVPGRGSRDCRTCTRERLRRSKARRRAATERAA